MIASSKTISTCTGKYNVPKVPSTPELLENENTLLSGPGEIWSMYCWWHGGGYFFLTLKPLSMKFDHDHCPTEELQNL